MYTIKNPADQAMGGLNQAAGTYGRMMRDIPANRDPGPTIGGGLMSGMGGAGMGAQIGTMVSSGSAAGPYGAIAGAVVGIGSYLLS